MLGKDDFRRLSTEKSILDISWSEECPIMCAQTYGLCYRCPDIRIVLQVSELCSLNEAASRLPGTILVCYWQVVVGPNFIISIYLVIKTEPA